MRPILTRLSVRPLLRTGLILLAVVTALFAAVRASAPPESTYRWATVQEIGSTEGLGSAAFLLSAQHYGIIWAASQSNAPLVYTPLDQVSHAQPLITFPGLAPRHWQALPAQASTYHLIWQDQNGPLYNALVDSRGETLRGPIELAPDASHFIALPYNKEHVLAAWVSQNKLFAAAIDEVGRPRQLLDPLLTDVSLLAGAADQASTLHLTWLVSSAPDNWTVNYRAAAPDNIEIEPFESLLTFQIKPGKIITAFNMGLDQSHGYVFWSIASADQPDIERVYSLSFLLEEPTDVQLSELTLPTRFEPDKQLPQSDFALGPVAGLPADSAAALRWPRPAAGQHAILPLAITVRMEETWYPAVVYYQSGTVLGYQIVAALPANAAPPTLAAATWGDLYLTWAGLQGTLPTLYMASTEGQGLIRD